jgi:hypothetical protein
VAEILHTVQLPAYALRSAGDGSTGKFISLHTVKKLPYISGNVLR